MKLKRVLIIMLSLLMLTGMAACSDEPVSEEIETPDLATPPGAAVPPETEAPVEETLGPMPKSTGKIYLYGETHGSERILDREFELWKGYYDNENMRHLFVEHSYFAAGILNVWMQSDGDGLLDDIYNGLPRSTESKEFYKRVKAECPETIFHGTDVGHGYKSDGEWYLLYLRNNGMEDSEEYLLAKESIDQGERYYYPEDDILREEGMQDHVFREIAMAENFIREFDKLEGESVMGIYGAAHTDPDALDRMTGSVPTMAALIYERYGDAFSTVDLRAEPERVEVMTVAGKDYEASYFGGQDAYWSARYDFVEHWRLEDAYEDFKNMPKNGNILPYHDYPMPVEEGQVFVVDWVKPDGSVVREYFRNDGGLWENSVPMTEEFILP